MLTTMNILTKVNELRWETQIAFEKVAEAFEGDTERQVACVLRLVQAQRLLACPHILISDVLEVERLLAEVAAELVTSQTQPMLKLDSLVHRLRQGLAQVSSQRQQDRWVAWRDTLAPRQARSAWVMPAK